jgi:histidine phosphotransfer protein HptB
MRMSDRIDAAVVAELKSIMDGDLDALLEAYRDDARDRLDALRTAVRAGDLTTVRLQAHSLKGASANLGAARLASHCATLEAAALQGGSACLERALHAVAMELAEVERALLLPPYRAG